MAEAVVASLCRIGAAAIGEHQNLLNRQLAGAVVSGLPLIAMGSEQQIDVLRGAFAYLRPGGAFYQFTYAHVAPARRRVLDRLGLEASRVGSTMWNAPPASVFRFTRRDSARRTGTPLPGAC